MIRADYAILDLIRYDHTMVALILTRRGFDDMRPRIDAARDAIWVGAGLLSDVEVDELRRAGTNLTVFAHALNPNDLDTDLSTVVEHHPGQTVWVEMPAA